MYRRESAIRNGSNWNGAEYAIRKVQENKDGLNPNGMYLALVYDDNVNFLGRSK
jgi:hypothetical protein